MSSSSHTRPTSTSSIYTHTRPVSTSSSLTPHTRPSSSSSSYSIGPLYPLSPKHHTNVTDTEKTATTDNVATSTNSSTTSVDFPYESIRKRKDSRTIKKLSVHKSFDQHNEVGIEGQDETEVVDAIQETHSTTPGLNDGIDDSQGNTTTAASPPRGRRRSVPQRILGWVRKRVQPDKRQ
jgi:hypothetical protein